MKFRMRLILGYAILAFATSFFLGVIYNNHLLQRYQDGIYNNIRFSSRQLLNNLDGNLQKMEQVALSVLSDQEMVQSIRELSVKMAEPKKNEAVILNAKGIVKNGICTAYNMENFYRVVVFNQYGYIAASVYMHDRMVDSNSDIGEIPWLESVKGTKGRNVLIGPHPDDWAVPSNQRQVFSLVREIQGNQLGYIEVQQTEEYFYGMFALPDDRNRVLALKPDGSILYVSEGVRLQDYAQYLTLEDQIFREVNENTKAAELISIETSEKSGIRIFLIEDWKVLMAENPSGWEMAFVVGGLFFVFALCFVIVMADLLTRPLQELRDKMENTQWHNLTDEIAIKSPDADIQALTDAYRDLTGRLKSSMEKEKKLNYLQLQAQFDTLQAQINPHFLYNVLNVISNRGMQDDDETICEICGHLAAMLRYSTNTKTRYATIGQEMHYIEEYFYLIKARYEDKISFEIQVEEGIRSQIVPKTVLQQMAENCIDHGFANSVSEMRIRVTGYEKDQRWYLKVADNGVGFGEEALKNLQEEIEKVRRCLFEERNHIELEIGGMGLLNTYARLLLIYNDSLTFTLGNSGEGAEIIFGAEMFKEEPDV